MATEAQTQQRFSGALRRGDAGATWTARCAPCQTYTRGCRRRAWVGVSVNAHQCSVVRTPHAHAQVARLAKQLPNKSADLKPMATFFNSKMSDGTDPAEEAPEDEGGELDLT